MKSFSGVSNLNKRFSKGNEITARTIIHKISSVFFVLFLIKLLYITTAKIKINNLIMIYNILLPHK